MSDNSLSRGWSRSRADRAAARFRVAMAAYLAFQVVVGLLCLIFAGSLVERSGSTGLLWIIGGFVLLSACLSLPAYLRPVRSRAMVLAVLVGGYLLGFLWLTAGGVFVTIGLIQLAAAALISVFLVRFYLAELQSRP